MTREGGAGGGTASRAEPFAARIERWLRRQGVLPVAVEPLAGDLSTRSYYRVRVAAGASLLVASYPRDLAPAQERFARAAELLRGAGIRVPRIAADDRARGLVLLEDLGPRTLYESASGWVEAARELTAAMEILGRVRALPAAAVEALGSPPLDRALLTSELERSVRVCLAPRGWADEALVAALAELCARLGEEPAVPCHRDFMARNLVPDGAGGLGVLDFQDLRLGPPAYDLAALLNDSLFADPASERRALAVGWARRLEPEQYGRSVVQRTLKAAGTFAAFAASGRGQHLALLEPTLARAAPHLARLPETAAAFRRLAPRWPRPTSAVC